MSLCVIAAGLPENLFALAIGLFCVGLGFAGTNVSRIVLLAVRRALRCVAIAAALYAVGEAPVQGAASFASGSLRDGMLAWIGLLSRIFAVQVHPPTQ